MLSPTDMKKKSTQKLDLLIKACLREKKEVRKF
jgi:hypothetical protein